jgi:hypothetical protein
LSFVAEGKAAELVMFLIALVAALYYLWRAVQGRTLEMREMAQYTALGEGIDRAVEEGRPVICTIGGYAYLSGLYAPMAIAGLNVMRYVVTETITRGADVRLPVGRQPEQHALIDGIYREATVAAGRPEAYNRENVQFFGSNVQYEAGIAGWIQRDGCSMYVMVGACGGGIDTVPLHWAYDAGALRVGGTARWPHQGTFTMLNDYPLHMDDIYGLGAVCSQDPIVMSVHGGADTVKFALAAIVFIGALLNAAGIPILDWLKL